MRYSCAVAICLLSAVAALGYPRPPEGTENIPKLMEEATLVCKGEVTSAPKPLSVADAPRMTGTATVRVDRCFKGDPGGSEIRVSVDSFLPPGGGPAFILNPGDYRVFFLKSLDGKYAVVDEWFGALRASREIAHAPGGGDPKLLLELDLKAGLHDSDPERVLDSIRMLGNMKTLRSTAELKTLLDAPDLLVKTYVWQALLRLKDYSVLPAVSEFFVAQPEAPRELFLPRDRLFAMQDELVCEVGTIRSLDALPYLERFAVSDKRFLRMEALQALRQIGSAHSASVLLRELDDPDPDNGFSAMQGLLALRAANSGIEWVPTWDEFRQSPQFYAAKTREWWASAKPLPMHSALKQALLEWKTQSHRTQATDFVFPSRLYGGRKALDLAAVLKRKIRPTFDKLGITGVGWHTFRHTVGTVLAELGEHQLTIRDYLRHSSLSVTKYLQAASNTKRNAQARLVAAILPVHLLPAGKTAETVAP